MGGGIASFICIDAAVMLRTRYIVDFFIHKYFLSGGDRFLCLIEERLGDPRDLERWDVWDYSKTF
ncbi:MAG: hypothetical protein QXX94_06295 [Candidatus Bathyarchaeia archaeon]